MADNVNITPGNGAVVAADDVGGVLFQRIKVTHGADGVADDVTAATPLPVAAVGAAAHDAAISGNPVRMAGRGVSANYTAVATGDTADIVTTLIGVQIQKPFSIPEADWFYSAAASGIDNSSTGVVMKAAVAGLRNYVTGISVEHDLLGGTTLLLLRDGASGAIMWRGKLQTPAKESVNILFPSPLRGSVNTDIVIQTLTAVTGGVFVNAQGYTAP